MLYLVNINFYRQVFFMASLSSMPKAGVAVIFLIAILFVLALIVLFGVYFRYKHIAGQISGTLHQDNKFLRYAVNQFAESYKRYGKDTNTPAIIEEAVGSRLGGSLLCERFLNNAVSLFVTLGLFGTFLGLSLSVGSLTSLIADSSADEWLSILDSVGSGLMSALSGMGVAFYTSLVGVACSILLTILRSIFSPAAARELMESRMELWLDQSVAPTLPTRAAQDDVDALHQMIDGLNAASAAMEASLKDATASLRSSLVGFNKTVDSFSEDVHDFSEFHYALQGTVERLDVSIRDFGNTVRGVTSRVERSENK